LDTPQFDRSEDTSYDAWKKTFEELDVASYDAAIAGSLGCPMIIEYLLEKQISLKRLVLMAPAMRTGKDHVQKILDDMVQDVSKL